MAEPTRQTFEDRLQAAIHTIDGSEMAKTVCKASTREMGPPKGKHLERLRQLTRECNVNQPELLNLIVLRTKEKKWVVVLKAQITLHHLMVNGSERVLQCAASRSELFVLDAFNDSTGQGYEMSNFIRRYSKYLNKRAAAYRTMAADFCKLKKGPDSIWNKMTHENLNKNMPVLQDLLDCLLDFSNQGSHQFQNAVVNSAFVLLHRDLVRLYATYNDGMIVVISKFHDMKLSHGKAALEIYKKFLAQLEIFQKFFQLAEQLGVVDRGEVPDLSKAPKSLLSTFEEHIKAGGGSGENSASSTPVKSAGEKAPSAITSPVHSGNIHDEVLREEAEAMARFESQKRTTSPQRPTPHVAPPAKLAAPITTAPVEQPKASYADDLLNLDAELGFAALTMQQVANTQQQQQQQAQTMQQPIGFNAFGQNGFAQPQMPAQPQMAAAMSNNPFAMPAAAAAPPASNTNPFNQGYAMAAASADPLGNPFQGTTGFNMNQMSAFPAQPALQPTALQPQTAMPAAQPQTTQSGKPADPFADLLGSAFSSATATTPQTQPMNSGGAGAAAMASNDFFSSMNGTGATSPFGGQPMAAAPAFEDPWANVGAAAGTQQQQPVANNAQSTNPFVF